MCPAEPQTCPYLRVYHWSWPWPLYPSLLRPGPCPRGHQEDNTLWIFCEFIYSGRHTYIHFITLSLFVIYNMQCIRRNGIREKSNNACRVPPLIYINRATGRQSMPTIIDAYIMTSSTSSMSKNTLSIALRDHEINSILQVGLTFLLSCVP